MTIEVASVFEAAAEGGHIARAADISIFIEAEDCTEFHAQIRDALSGHFDAGAVPYLLHLHTIS